MDTLKHVDDQPVFMGEVYIYDVSEKDGRFICSIRLMQNRIIDRSMSGTQVVEEVSELFTTGFMFSPEIQATKMAHKYLRYWFNDNGSKMPPHSSLRVINQIAASLFNEDKYKAAAEEMEK